MDINFFQTLFLSLKLAFVSTIILVFVGIFLAYVLSFTNFIFKDFLQLISSMPLVLPPSVLGFYLLLLFSPNNLLGEFLDKYLNLRLVFSFEGLVLGSVISSLPFMLAPIQSAFCALPKNIIECSYTLGRGKLYTLLRIIIPNSKLGLLSGVVVSFAHTMGEFGLVMMIGGHIKGETLLASIAVYDELEALNYDLAHKYALSLLLFSFFLLLSLILIKKKLERKDK